LHDKWSAIAFPLGKGINHNLFSSAQVARCMLAGKPILLVHMKASAAVQEFRTIIVGVVAQGSEHDQVAKLAGARRG
jgi:hypothetical protein